VETVAAVYFSYNAVAHTKPPRSRCWVVFSHGGRLSVYGANMWGHNSCTQECSFFFFYLNAIFLHESHCVKLGDPGDPGETRRRVPRTSVFPENWSPENIIFLRTKGFSEMWQLFLTGSHGWSCDQWIILHDGGFPRNLG